MSTVLSSITGPEKLNELSQGELDQLCNELRQSIIDTVSQQGGHLASNLGVVELTVALHRVFESPKDKIIFDVGHQAYTHKLLTGRGEAFGTLRSYGGISGFPRREESEHDIYDAGHSSTSISSAVGLARARDIQNEDYNVVAVIGDGAMTGGMCYEAMNDAGNMNSRLIVILNDNEMSISRNVGGIASHLTRLRSSAGWRGTKTAVKHGIEHIPIIGVPLAKRVEQFKNTFKHFFTHGELFESLGFRYLGPIDGHDLPMLERVLSEAKLVTDIPLLIHVITQKGHGYELAERKPEKFHGVAPFFAENGVKRELSPQPGTAKVVGDTLCDMAQDDKRIVAVTAAMSAGTGLSAFSKKFPKRFFDVGIAEQHALTMSSGLARGGLRPYFVVYSSFLQRGYDQIIHDICLQKLPVCILVDHAGLVGEDGSTHHGVFDVSFLQSAPDITILAPRDIHQLRQMLLASAAFEGPSAIRYIKEGIDMSEAFPVGEYQHGKWETLITGDDLNIICHGRMVSHGVEVSKLLSDQHISCGVINATCIKPMDETCLHQLCQASSRIITLEEVVCHGSLGESIDRFCVENGYSSPMDNICLDDRFITHGTMDTLLNECGLMPSQVAERIMHKMEKQ